MNADSTARRMLGLYRLLLNLYPRAFRDVFGEELSGVVELSLREAGSFGRRALWTYFLREVLDMLPNVLREYISSRSFNRFVERMLAHRQHSRWRQAGALGFALGFGAMELVNQVGRFFPNPPFFPGSAAHISILNQPDGSLSITPFQWIGLLMLLTCGLVAGSLLNRAEPPVNRLLLPLGAAASLAGSYALLYGVNSLLWMAQNGLPYVYMLFNILNPWLFGGLAALGLGLAQRLAFPRPGQSGRRWHKLGFAGVGGIFIGGLAGWVIIIALSLVDWIERSVEALISHHAVMPATGLLSGFFLYPAIVAVLFSTVEGWVYGGQVGNQLGAGRGAPRTASQGVPISDGLAKLVIAVLVVIVILSLLMLSIRTSQS